MAHFLLIHGMFHGGWCWDRLVPRLEAQGHRVTAPDLAGCAKDTTPAAEVTLDRWATDVAAIAGASNEPVILVGHSRGGLVIGPVAEKVPEKIAALVYLTAILLPDGGSPMAIAQVMAEEGFIATRPMMAPGFSEDGLLILPPADAGEIFYGPCTPEDRAWAEPQIGPEPFAPMMATVSLSEERWGSIPRIYVETTEDRTLDIAAQRAMVARVGVDEVITMHTDHMPMFTDLDELTAILLGVAERCAR